MRTEKLLLVAGVTAGLYGMARAIWIAPAWCALPAILFLVFAAFNVDHFETWVHVALAVMMIFVIVLSFGFGSFGLFFGGWLFCLLILSVFDTDYPKNEWQCIDKELDYDWKTNACYDHGRLVVRFDEHGWAIPPGKATQPAVAVARHSHPTLGGIFLLVVALSGYAFVKKYVRRWREKRSGVQRLRAYEIALQYDPSAAMYPPPDIAGEAWERLFRR